MSKKFVVTTTINPVQEATARYAAMRDWTLIVVGDKKTPHKEYEDLNCIYLHPDYQQSEYRLVSDSIGWGSIQRRNIGFLEAYKLGAEVVATVDDDNIPYVDWGKDLLVGKTVECDLWEPEADVFDPLSVTKSNSVWHRGYPIELVPERHRVQYKGKTLRKVLVQADLWDGDPDIDAMARLSQKPCVKFDEITGPYCSNKISPFNSQNTFLHRDVLPFYAVLPHIGRMDDIWGSYILQYLIPNCVVYNKASVYQDRNVQDLVTNLENEIIGYRLTYKMLNDMDHYGEYLTDHAKMFWFQYRKAYENLCD